MTSRQLSTLAVFNLSFHWFSIGIIIPVLSLFLLDKGITLFQLGIITASYSAATVLLEVPTGTLADSIGRRNVYMLSLVLQLVSIVFLIFAGDFYMLMAGTIASGAARALSSGTMDAYFIDEFYSINPQVDLQKEFARIGTFIPAALGAGALIGGFSPVWFGGLEGYLPGGNKYSPAYILFGAAVILQILFTLVLVKNDRKITSDSDKKETESPFKILKNAAYAGIKNPVILLLLLSGTAWGFSVSGLEQLWQPRFREIIAGRYDTWIFGLMTAGYFAAGSLGNLVSIPIGKLLKKNYSLMLFMARLGMGALFMVLAFQGSVSGFALFYIGLFTFNGIESSPATALLNSEVGSEIRSTMLSYSSLFMQLGGIGGSVIMGFMAQCYSIPSAWKIGAVVLMLSSILFLSISAVRKNKEALNNEV